ncbi:MAG TPA: hypothetical protein VF759_16960 [Allosphingosinicella sp.]|jgi:hypothetical protein
MTTETAGIFTIDYKLRTNAEAGSDIQFGMDFTLSQSKTAATLPLTQLVFPAVKVGTNEPGQWNVDNHLAASDDPTCLIFPKANEGTIKDQPTELSKRGKGVLKTKFAVYRVNVAERVVQLSGVTFGYQIDTGASKPTTAFTGIKKLEIPKDQQKVILAQCSKVAFR